MKRNKNLLFYIFLYSGLLFPGPSNQFLSSYLALLNEVSTVPIMAKGLYKVSESVLLCT